MLWKVFFERGGLGSHASCYPVSAACLFFFRHLGCWLQTTTYLSADCVFVFFMNSVALESVFWTTFALRGNLGPLWAPSVIQGTVSLSSFATLGHTFPPKVSPREPEDRPAGPGIVFLGFGVQSEPPNQSFFNFVCNLLLYFACVFSWPQGAIG